MLTHRALPRTQTLVTQAAGRAASEPQAADRRVRDPVVQAAPKMVLEQSSRRTFICRRTGSVRAGACMT
jgi:hypothetical protein